MSRPAARRPDGDRRRFRSPAASASSGAVKSSVARARRTSRAGRARRARRRRAAAHESRVPAPPSRRLVQQLLARERALLRGQRLVLEALQLRRDVALGVFQRLAAPVIFGNLVGLRARDFDVEAVHAVVFDLEIGDTAARALASLEIEQELPAVAVRCARSSSSSASKPSAITPPSRTICAAGSAAMARGKQRAQRFPRLHAMASSHSRGLSSAASCG